MIYFIKTVKSDSNLVKIGYTKDKGSLVNRIASLRTASPYELEIYHTMDGDHTIESGLHKLFAEHRVNGEWFELHQEIISFVEERKADQMISVKSGKLPIWNADCVTPFELNELDHSMSTVLTLEENFVVRCPECGCEYNHPSQVIVTHGNDDGPTTGHVSILRDGTVTHSKENTVIGCRSRGNDVFMVFECEYGHLWQRSMQFHKGVTEMHDKTICELER